MSRILKNRIKKNYKFNIKYYLDLFINKIMIDGKKELAYKLLKELLDKLERNKKENNIPCIYILLKTIKKLFPVSAINSAPSFTEIAKAKIYEEHVLSSIEQYKFAIRFLLKATNLNKGLGFTDKLVNEIISVYENTTNSESFKLKREFERKTFRKILEYNDNITAKNQRFKPKDLSEREKRLNTKLKNIQKKSYGLDEKEILKFKIKK